MRKNPSSVQKVVSGICNIFSTSLFEDSSKSKKRYSPVMSPLQIDVAGSCSNEGSSSRTPSGLLSEESSDSSPPCNRTISVSTSKSQEGIVFCTQQPDDDQYVLLKVSPASSTGTTAFEPFQENTQATVNSNRRHSLDSECPVSLVLLKSVCIAIFSISIYYLPSLL